MEIILPSLYLAPISYYYLLVNNQCVIDVHEHFVKQTFRNRCTILGANGKLNLIIPIQKRANHTPINEIKISYAENWQRNHWQSIVSAYNKSPFFEYYKHEIIHLFNEKHEFLIDFNLKANIIIQKILQIDTNYQIASAYIHNQTISDHRNSFSPKKPILNLYYKSYIQVFSSKFSFVDNLSIIDLIFNEGPNSKNYLLNHVKSL